ncbi:MAG: tetratricopeptide repeat protein [Saprospiraceae bacterium]|jgi:hypothetical protein|nr:tetratricopeptide repeat protein [Saprospiraceae bacterium]
MNFFLRGFFIDIVIYKIINISSFLLLLAFTGQGQSKLSITKDLEVAYQDISKLKIIRGQQKINQIKFSDKNNAMVYYIENYIDFFVLFIQEDATLYKKLLKNKDIRLSKIKNSDKNSPYYLFCQAEIILQWATIKLKFDDKIGAAKDVFTAYNLLEENKDKFPDFTENNKSLSIIHALAESVPSWVRKIMGITGSIALGTKEISLLAKKAHNNNSIFKNEIVAIYSYILFYSNNNKEEAFQLYEKYNLDHKTNPLIAFLKATMAHKTGRNELAIKILEERPKSAEHLPFYYLDFLYGKYKLYKLDKDANKYILKFLNNFKGQHYLKEAWQKMAWYDLVIQNNISAYKKDMKYCIEKGNALIDEDIQALKEAKISTIPNEVLLKARMLYDGGYYSKAQNLLILNGKFFINAIHDGEYYYRLGRVTDALKNYKDALEYYELTITSSDTDKYYACSAALNAGLIYEILKKDKLALTYFNKCLSLNPAGYSSSLHQKAKSGIDRVKK